MPPPVSPGTSPIQLILFEDEVGAVEWNTTTEEVLGGVGRARITFQEREPAGADWEPFVQLPVTVIIRSSGWVLFHGEIIGFSFSLPPGIEFRTWTLDCRDYNSALDERLLAPDQYAMIQAGAGEPFIPISPLYGFNAPSAADISDLVDTYLGIGPPAIDSTTFVEDFTPAINTGVSIFDFTTSTTFRGAIATLDALADVNVQAWLDPDDNFHNQAIPIAADLIADGTAGDNLPAAPAEIGPGGVGVMALSVTMDGQAMVREVYVQGGTGATEDADTSIRTPGGTGWYPSATPSKNTRQAFVSAPGSWSDDMRITFAEAALRRAQNPTIRGSVTVQGVDGWRVGQVVTINDERLPPSLQGSHKFVIQRVATSLYPGTDIRQYVLDFGDGSINALASGGVPEQAQGQAPEEIRPPAIVWTADWADFGSLGAGETRAVVFTPRNGKGDPWGPPGVPFTLTVEARDADGNIVGGEGSFSPSSGTTDQDGKARSVLTAGDVDGLYYTGFLETTLAPA